jgi:hypothetical protein
MTAGQLPRRARNLVREWATLPRMKLDHARETARRSLPPAPITPAVLNFVLPHFNH